MLPDLTPILWLAVVGLIAIVAALLIGIPMALWWVFNHVQIV